MNIFITESTIRFEDENGSHAWPLYMDAPVDHPIITALDIQETPVLVRFDDSTCTITAGNDKITPETILDDYPEEVRVFAQTIYGYDPENGEGCYAEIWRLSQIVEKGDEPDEPLTKKEMRPVNREINGKLCQVFEEVDVPDMEPARDLWCAEGTRIIGKVPGKQKVKKGKKVPESVKLRLEELRSKDNGQERP